MKLVQVPRTAAKPATGRRPSPSDHQLSALAALHRAIETKVHARLALGHNGFASSDTAVNALMARILEINRARRDRAGLRVMRRLGSVPPGFCTYLPATQPVRLPAGSPAQRLEKVRERAVVQSAQQCLRYGAAGGTSFSVTLTSDAAQVGYRVEMGSNRDTYGGAYKGWQAAEDHHHICAPADWRVRVQRRGLATVGGMLTLDLQPLVPHGDIELFQAVWVAQGRGYAVNVQRGVIARLRGEAFHGADASDAIRGVTRKAARALAPQRTPTCSYELSVDAFIQRFSRYRHIPVSLDDARETGACEYGISSWCQAVGIDMALESVTLRRVLEGFQTRPLVEVRRTVLHAVRAHRSQTKLTSSRSAMCLR